MFYIGLDLGQRRDHSAIAVVERADRHLAHLAPRHDEMMLRYVERIPLGTTYTQVAMTMREMVRSEELYGQCALVVDATGVGAPVVEMLRGAGLGCEICAVTITGGERETQQGSTWNVPKRDLIAGVQVLLEKEQLQIARGMRDLGALVEELVDMRAVTRENGKVRMGADGYGEHDDLAIAVALACWRARRPRVGYVARRLPGI